MRCPAASRRASSYTYNRREDARGRRDRRLPQPLGLPEAALDEPAPRPEREPARPAERRGPAGRGRHLPARLQGVVGPGEQALRRARVPTAPASTRRSTTCSTRRTSSSRTPTARLSRASSRSGSRRARSRSACGSAATGAAEASRWVSSICFVDDDPEELRRFRQLLGRRFVVGGGTSSRRPSPTCSRRAGSAPTCRPRPLLRRGRAEHRGRAGRARAGVGALPRGEGAARGDARSPATVSDGGPRARPPRRPRDPRRSCRFPHAQGNAGGCDRRARGGRLGDREEARPGRARAPGLARGRGAGRRACPRPAEGGPRPRARRRGPTDAAGRPRTPARRRPLSDVPDRGLQPGGGRGAAGRGPAGGLA